MPTKQYRALKDFLMQAYPICECCGDEKSFEVNHCLYHVHGGIFDTVENCQAVGVRCRETQKDNSMENRNRHWDKRVLEGYNMQGWNQQVPMSRRRNWGSGEVRQLS